MNRSAPLSAEARRLLELGSEVEAPTAEQNARMNRALAPLFQTGRSGMRTQTAPRQMPRFLEPWHGFLKPGCFLKPNWLRDAKLWLTFGALAATASASFWLGRTSLPAEEAPALAPAVQHIESADPVSADPESTGPVSADPESADPVATSPFTPVVGSSPALASAASEADAPDSAAQSSAPFGLGAASVGSAAREAAVRGKPGVRRGNRRAQHSLGLGAEIEQLARAEAALRQGRAAHTLRVLEQGTVLHLLEQAAALRAIAECELGVSAATTRAGAVLDRWPSSPFQPRIVQACGL